jgi:hypothetical protein
MAWEKVRAFGAFEAIRLFSAPPSPICEPGQRAHAGQQDQIIPIHHDLKAQYDLTISRAEKSRPAIRKG